MKADTCTCMIAMISVFINWDILTLSHPKALCWGVKPSGVRQSKITKGTVLADLGGKGLMS